MWIFCSPIALVNPDGSPRSGSRAADYALLSRYLERRSGLEVGTPVGVFANLGALGHAANEIHLPTQSLVRCQFNNAGTYWPPVDPALLDAFHLGWHAHLGDELLALATLYVNGGKKP